MPKPQEFLKAICICATVPLLVGIIVMVLWMFVMGAIHHDSIRMGMITLLAAMGASPILLLCCFGYSIPIMTLSYASGLIKLVRRFNRSSWVILLGLLTGCLYWLVIDLFLPFYPAGRLLIPAYLGSSIGVASSFLYLYKSDKQALENKTLHPTTHRG
jgi:hypothetical protein